MHLSSCIKQLAVTHISTAIVCLNFDFDRVRHLMSGFAHVGMYEVSNQYPDERPKNDARSIIRSPDESVSMQDEFALGAMSCQNLARKYLIM
jgi:hypothetical protein